MSAKTVELAKYAFELAVKVIAEDGCSWGDAKTVVLDVFEEKGMPKSWRAETEWEMEKMCSSVIR